MAVMHEFQQLAETERGTMRGNVEAIRRWADSDIASVREARVISVQNPRCKGCRGTLFPVRHLESDQSCTFLRSAHARSPWAGLLQRPLRCGHVP